MSEDESPDSDLESWLSPSEALSHVREYLADGEVAKRAIINRLRGGQIHACAAKSAEASRERTDVMIPKDEWGSYSSASNDFWHTGDIRFFIRITHARGKSSRTVRYFGVKFDKTGIAALVAGLPKKNLPNEAENFSAWLTPEEAIKRVKEAVREGIRVEGPFLDSLKGGLVRSASQRSATVGEFSSPDITDEPTEIPPHWWEAVQSEEFWTTGIAFFDMRDPHTFGLSSARTRCFGIRFDPTGVQELIDSLPKRGVATPIQTAQDIHRDAPFLTPTTTPISKSKGGPTPKEWWEDLWIEMFRRIHFGEFTPKKQADLEKAMHEWLALRGKSASERTIRNAARKLFGALKEKGQ